MTDSGSDDENGKKIELKFKTIQETYNVKVNENASIKQLKQTMSKKLNQPEEKICLIFSGKILKDHENLVQHRIGDGMVLHMVIRNQPSSGATATSSASNVPTGAAAAPSFAGVPPSMGGIGELFNNPELVQGILNSPFMDSMLANPDIIRTMLSQNPQFQQIIQNNPELGHIMNDPATMRHAMEMIRNPTALNELMRNHDQAIRNLQGIPGGEAALQRLYERVQEPLMNMAQPGVENAILGSGAQNTTDSSRAASRSQHAGVENAQPLPNPWSNLINQQNRQGPGVAGSAPAQGAAAAANLPFANMMNTPGMQSLFRQISSNQSAMQQLMSQDNMRHFTQMISNNPTFFQQMMQSFPGFNSPEIAEQIRNNMPQITSLMTNPQMLQAMSNPRVINALQQIQQASQVLRQEAPQLFANFPGADMFQNLGGMAGLFGGIANAATQAQPPTSAGGTEMPTQPNVPAGQNIPTGFAELLGSLMNLSTTVNNNQPLEERFRGQLEQLTAMGFTDQQANIQALLASFGDLPGAIDRLLNGGQGNADTF